MERENHIQYQTSERLVYACELAQTLGTGRKGMWSACQLVKVMVLNSVLWQQDTSLKYTLSKSSSWEHSFLRRKGMSAWICIDTALKKPHNFKHKQYGCKIFQKHRKLDQENKTNEQTKITNSPKKPNKPTTAWFLLYHSNVGISFVYSEIKHNNTALQCTVLVRSKPHIFVM